jgi:hypothetical protein
MMPRAGPPAPGRLTRLPRRRLETLTLHRIYRRDRRTPWWFASLNPERPPMEQGRFDLPAPDGTCYLARAAVGAVLEVFQEHDGLLPDVELRRRLRAEVRAHGSAPNAADLSAGRREARGSRPRCGSVATGRSASSGRWPFDAPVGWRSIMASPTIRRGGSGPCRCSTGPASTRRTMTTAGRTDLGRSRGTPRSSPHWPRTGSRWCPPIRS